MESSQGPPPEGSAPTPPGGPVGPTPPPGGEAAGTSGAPPAAGAQAPPPDDGRANAGLRIGAVALALVLAIICAVGIAVMVDVGDTQLCEDVSSAQRSLGGYECYDFSGSIKPVVVGAGWAGSVLAGIAALLAVAFAIRGRGGRIVLAASGAAAVLVAISIIAAQV